MKRIFVSLLALLLAGATTVIAHEAHDKGGAGLFGNTPEYIHVLLNPLPVYALAVGVAALAVSLLRRIKSFQTFALITIIAASAAAWPVLKSGHSAYSRIRPLADEKGQGWLDEHMERADKLVYVFYGAAGLGIAALVARRKSEKASTVLASLTLVVGIGALGAGGWISYAGGKIRHPEFRPEASQISTNEHKTEHK
jgi:hypothetical protein